MPAASVCYNLSCAAKARASRFIKKVLIYRALFIFSGKGGSMYTKESFCNSIWENSYSKVLSNVAKEDYKEFKIAKKGGFRTINYLEKDSALWDLQHRLLYNFLETQALPVCVKGFKKGESYKSFLYEHIGANYFLRIDIASFFPSINTNWIKTELSNLLVCDSDDEKGALLDLICDIVTLDNALPQGASTSPAISNIVMARIDQRITKYCQVFNIRYTRYADDLLFSSSSFNFSEKKWFIKKIKHILATQNLRLNYSKMKYGEKELVLNGYVVSKQGIRLSRNRLSDVRRVVTFSRDNFCVLKCDGPEEFLKKANSMSLKHRDLKTYPFNTLFQFTQYLCGYRSFLISMVDANDTSSTFQKELQRLIRRTETQILRLS